MLIFSSVAVCKVISFTDHYVVLGVCRAALMHGQRERLLEVIMINSLLPQDRYLPLLCDLARNSSKN